MSKKRLIVLVGASGSGKRSAVVQACKNADLVYQQKLVDPSHFKADDLPTDQMHACIVNNLLFNTIEDVDKYLHQIKSRMCPLDNVITFLPLSIGNCKDIVLKHLLDQLRLEGAAIIGVPEWTEKDLRFCFGNGNGEIVAGNGKSRSDCSSQLRGSSDQEVELAPTRPASWPRDPGPPQAWPPQAYD